MNPILDYLDKRIETINARLEMIESAKERYKSLSKEEKVTLTGEDLFALNNQLLGALIELKRTRGEILAGNVKGFEL